jgi:thiol:disulfide interchange protein DsbA
MKERHYEEDSTMGYRTITTMNKKLIATGVALCGFIAIFVFAPSTGHSTESPIPSFGEGKVKVRLYTDYFCPPCTEMEPDLEPVIRELVKEKTINLIFADTPFHRHSSLYARYFLYAVNEKNDLEHAFFVRRSLIEATKKRVDSAERIEAILKEKGIKLKPFDPKPVFTALTNHLKEDQIDATPSCIIEKNGKKNKYVGASDIINALNQLKGTAK